MTRMTAKYNGRCAVCGTVIRAGEAIEYDRAQGGARHPACVPYTPGPDDIWISQGEGYGGHAFQVGAVMRNPRHDVPIPAYYDGEAHAREERAAAPVYLYVLHARQEYYHEDGYSFGVGDESGYVYGAYCRPATDEESAGLRAEEARMTAHRNARHELDALRRRCRREGAFPAQAALDAGGHVLLDARTIYGGGDEWYVAPGCIWYIEGNGGDGDDWSRNNLGGNAMAWRLTDADGALAGRLEALTALLDTREEVEA